jgi:hypothetical protein
LEELTDKLSSAPYDPLSYAYAFQGLNAHHKDIRGVRMQMGLILRRVPTGHHPTPTCPHKVLIVEFKGSNCSMPTSRSTNDQGAILAPTKVFTPSLTAWIKEGYSLTAFRVNAMCLCSLVAIAQRTSQPEVLFSGGAACCQGDDMFNMHGHRSVRLRGQAITTPIACLGDDFLPQGLGDVRAYHENYPSSSCMGTR